MAKKEKKKKEKKDSAEPKQEVDAVKGFIVVMVLLIIALGVFIVITMKQLEVVEQKVAIARNNVVRMGLKSLEVRSYLRLIKDSEERLLINFPERFFGRIYQSPEISIAPSQVTLGAKKDTLNRKMKYREFFWDLDIRDITRKQATLFLHGVENDSPKAKIIEVSLRRARKKDAPPDTWDAHFKIGYRVAGTK